MSDNFWENIDQYRKLGFDPLRWVPTCSTEIDSHTFKSALADVKKSSVKISPTWFDWFHHIDGKRPELTRRVYDFANPVMDKELEIKRALAIFRIHAGTDQPAMLSEALQNFFKVFNTKVSVSCATISVTEHADAQFGMLDYIELHRGDKIGYMPGVTSATQVTDVTLAPDAELHSNIAMTSAIELLNLLGCGIPSSFKLFPVYDAPSDTILDKIRSNLDSFTSRYNLAMEDYSSLKTAKLFYGTSALANTTKELPVKYESVEEGMELIVTNKFGGLPAISLFTLAQIDSANVKKFEENGIALDSITRAKEEAIKNLSEPHFALGKIMAKYCPDFGSQYDKNLHVTAVQPVGSNGVLALGKLAELANTSLVIEELPLRDSEISRFATKEFLLENATASMNGCHVIVAAKEVANLIAEDLKKHNFNPERIGSVGKKGEVSVKFQPDVSQFVSSKAKLSNIISPAVQPSLQP